MFFAERRGSTLVEMMAAFDVKDPIQLIVRGVVYRSRVDSVPREGLRLMWPTVSGVPLAVEVGDTLTVTFSSRTGMPSFLGRVMDCKPGRPGTLHVVPLEPASDQQRQFARVPRMQPLHFRVRVEKAQAQVMKATTRNISGGGMLLLVEQAERPRPGSVLDLDFDLPDAKPILARAAVLRTTPCPSRSGLFQVAIRFIEIDERDRSRIIQYVFAREAELHRAGLL